MLGCRRQTVAIACAALVWCAQSASAKKRDVLQADRIVIVKSARTLTLLRQGQVLKTYKVALGEEPTGAKTKRGDGRTPEGEYIIDSRNPHSQFHLSLHVS